MATFTESQITDIGEILEINSDYLANHLSFYASLIKDSDKVAILAKVEIFKEIERDFVKFKSTESNQGFDSDPEREKESIRRKIANWTYCTGLLPSSSAQGVLIKL